MIKPTYFCCSFARNDFIINNDPALETASLVNNMAGRALWVVTDTRVGSPQGMAHLFVSLLNITHGFFIFYCLLGPLLTITPHRQSIQLTRRLAQRLHMP